MTKKERPLEKKTRWPLLMLVLEHVRFGDQAA